MRFPFFLRPPAVATADLHHHRPQQALLLPPLARPPNFLSLRPAAARAGILPAAAAGRRSRRMVPENDIGRRRPVEKSHRGVITVLLSTAVCTNFLICTDAPVIETTSTELTTAVALGKRRRGPRLELGPRS